MREVWNLWQNTVAKLSLSKPLRSKGWTRTVDSHGSTSWRGIDLISKKLCCEPRAVRRTWKGELSTCRYYNHGEDIRCTMQKHMDSSNSSKPNSLHAQP